MFISIFIPDFASWVRGQLVPERTSIAVVADGRVVSCTPDVRSAGVRIGERAERARSLAPEAALYERDPQLESALWEDVLYLLADASPHLSSIRPGWALLQPFDATAIELVARSLKAQLGSGPDRLSAMLASLMASRGTALHIAPRERNRALARSPVRLLHELGIDMEIIERLLLFGHATIGGAMQLSRRHLRAQFGAAGEELHDLLHPADPARPVPAFIPPPSVTAAHEFEQPVVEPADTHPVLHELVQRAVAMLGTSVAGRITLHLRSRSGEGLRVLRRMLKAPTARPAHLNVVAERLLDRLIRPEEPIDHIALELGGLAVPGTTQESLFAIRPEVYETVRRIHERFPNRLFRAAIVAPNAYLPEERVKLEPYPQAPPARKGGRR